MKESGSYGERCWSQASLGSEAEHGRRPNVQFGSPCHLWAGPSKATTRNDLAPRKVVQSYKKNAIAPVVRSCVDLVAFYYVRLYHIISQYYIRSSRIVYQ
jgi:hypothetical protein